MWVALALVVALIPYAPLPARGATLLVPSESYPTIQSAIDAAISGDTIQVDAGTYVENLTMPTSITLTIQGSGASGTVIDGSEGLGLPVISTGGESVLTLRDLTITGGDNQAATGDTVGEGGGIRVGNTASLTAERVFVEANVADTGGGIHVHTSGSLTTIQSTIRNNTGNQGGGGIYLDPSSIANVIDSTISSNLAPFSAGGGILADSTEGNGATLSVDNSTISGNDAEGGGDGIHAEVGSTVSLDFTTVANQPGLGLVADEGSTFTVDRTILSGNNGESVECSGSFLVTVGFNLIQDLDGSCNGLDGSENSVIGEPADLGPLASNGGPTETHLPGTASPAIDAAGGCEAVDQRGVSRPQGGACDIGSVELELGEPDLVGSISGPQQACRWDAIGDEITLQVTNQGDAAASGTSFSVGVYLSSDPTITTSDTLLKGGREFVSGETVIEPGQTINVPLFSGASVPGTVATGAAYLGLVVDEFDAVAETNETNNAAAVPITIVDSCFPLFGVESNTDSLSIIDFATGGGTVIGSLDPDPDIYVTPIAMSVHPVSGELYVWNNSNVSDGTLVNTGVLLVADRCTGLGAPVDPNETPQGQISALAFHPGGTLYGLDTALYQIDLTNGTRTEIAAFDGIRIVAADFASDGTLYAVDLPVTGAPRLFTVDTTDGVLDEVGPLTPETSAQTIAFAPNGTLVGSGGGQLYQIDPVPSPEDGTVAVSNHRALSVPEPQGMDFATPCDLAGTVVVDSVTVDDSTLEAGYAVPLAEIPPQRLVAGASAIVGAPMGAIEVAESPMGAIPLGAIPLGAIGGSTALGQTLLSEIPIEGGWEPLLAETQFEGRPLQTLTLDEIFSVPPPDGVDPVDLATLNLASIRLGNTGLSDLSLAALMLGDVPLSEMCSDPACTGDSVLDIETSGGSVASVPIGAIPMGAIPMGAIGDLAAAPMGAIPIGAIPIGAIPLGAIGDIEANPLGAIPMGAIGDLAAAPTESVPIGAIPMGAIPIGAIPIGAIPIGAIPLGAIPIGAIGGGCSGAVDCSFAGVDDSTTVEEYLVLTGSSDIVSSPLGAILLGQLPMGAIPMGAIPIGAIPLGAIPIGAITTATPLGAITIGEISAAAGVSVEDVCAEADDPTTCDENMILAVYATSISGASTLEGTPIGAIPLGAIPIGAITFLALELNGVPIGAIKVAGVPLGAIELDSIDLVNSPIGAIPIGAIPIGAICGDPGTAETLLEVAAVGALCEDDPATSADEDATLSDLGAALDGFTLADVLEHLTIGFLGQILEFDSLAFAELVVSILLKLDFPWEELPLDQIETRDVACDFSTTTRTCTRGDLRTPVDLGEPDIANVTVDFTVSGGPVVGEVVEVTIPEGWVILPGSSQMTEQVEGGSTFPVADPRETGSNLFTFTVPQIGEGIYTLQFAVAAGFDLGDSVGISAEEVSGDEIIVESLVSTGPIAVVDGLEFGDDPVESVRDLEPDTLWVGYINLEGDEDWWRTAAPESGFRVAVYLSNLAGDIDTFVWRPATAPLGDDTAERDIPLGIQPFDDDDIDLGGGGSLSPELLADSPLQEPAGTVLGDASANRGIADEFAEFTSRSEEFGDPYTIQVAGFQDATSDSPYVLRVRYRAEVPTPMCTPRTHLGLTTPSLPSIPSNVNTIFLANWERMAVLYPDADVAALQTKVENFAGSIVGGVPINGVVVPIGAIPGVASAFAAWDDNPCDPNAANAVADPIIAFIQGVAASHPTLRHVAIIGGDEQVPFLRLDDETIVANESTYTEGLGDNALFGAHFTRHYLSDSPYGDLDPIPWLDRFAYIKELGVGRLVESPSDISGAFDTFVDNNGVLDPATTATAGYDFLTDGAQEVRANLSGLTDLDSGDALLTETWTATQLGDIAYGASGGSAADVISPNAHYDHHRLLPASENLTQTENDLFTIADLPAGSVPNRIVLTMGCHAGLSVDDRAGGVIVQPTDWAQAYGTQQAVYIGNTGYGYGDTATVALSEQMIVNVADALGNGLTIAQNLSQAGQDQFGEAGLYGVYDLKAIEEATLYGLPMWRVSVAGASPITGNGSDTGAVLPDSQTGLLAAPFSKSPVFSPESAPLNADGTSDGTFFTADGGTQFMHWRPITPKTEVNATQDGLVATGAILTDLVSSDIPGVDAVFARPNTADQAGREPEVEFPDVIFPTTFATLGTYELLNPESSGDPTTHQQKLNLLAGQYIGPTSTQRLFDRMDGQIYYVPEGTAVDWTPPRILDVDAQVSGSDVGFLVDASDVESGVSRVVVLYRSSQSGNVSDWTAVDLIPLGGGTWAGGGTTEIAQPDFIVQALNGDGVPGTAVFKGELYQAELIPAADPNQPPVVGPISAPTDPVQLGTTIQASASFTDDGVLSEAVWSWGDGTVTDGVVDTANGVITGDHTYAASGVYRVRLVVVDDGGLVDESVFEFVVIYDPEGGFVTGSGWIDSPAGAYVAEPTLTGKATFGFVSKYQKGKTVPQGNTTFKFHTADLDFRSTEYEWLVISGTHKAQYKGSGIINGGGDYRFILTAIDAEQTSSTDTDLFRIKIWWEDELGEEHLVYDNQVDPNAADDADPTTAIAGGSIVIHTQGSGGPN